MSVKKEDETRSQTSIEHGGSAPSEESDVVAHVGVKTVEATHKVFGKYSKWVLFGSLGLASYIYSLDSVTAYTFLNWAAFDYKKLDLLSVLTVAQGIILAVGKPIIAKVADISSRGSAYFLVLLFYVLGYIIVASSRNFGTVIGGSVLYAVGNTGLQLLTQIIIADVTTLKWRGLVSSLMSMPFIINAFVGSNVSSAIVAKSGWRWGFGMFAILVPATLSPLICTLLWAERKARKQGLIDAALRHHVAPEVKTRTFAQKTWSVAQKLDVIGLLVIGTSVALILLPLTLTRTASGGWKNPSMIAMLVVGGLLIPVFAIWDFKYAKYPVLAPRFCLNRGVVIPALIGAFDFVSFYLTFTYLYSFILVVKPWSPVNANYFIYTQTVALTIFGITAGVLLRFLHRYKYVLVAGLSIRLVGVALMIHSRGARGTDAEVVWAQLLQGIGGGFAAVASQVGAQASVPHADVAMVTAVVLLVTEIGGAIGGAVAGAIWSNSMPGKLEKYLPFLNETERATIFGSVTSIIVLPIDDPTRVGAIQAYDDVMKIMVITATVISVFPLGLSLLVPNWYLGDTQNAVDKIALTGERAEENDADSTRK